MSKMVFIETPTVPNYIMRDLRQRRDLDEDDISQDEDILKMSGFTLFDEWLKWNGFIGYTSDFIDVIYAAYGVDLTEEPFDGRIERNCE